MAPAKQQAQSTLNIREDFYWAILLITSVILTFVTESIPCIKFLMQDWEAMVVILSRHQILRLRGIIISRLKQQTCWQEGPLRFQHQQHKDGCGSPLETY